MCTTRGGPITPQLAFRVNSAGRTRPAHGDRRRQRYRARVTSSDPRELPEDPDLEVDEGTDGTPVAVHLTPTFIALVALGGAAGSLARHGVEGLVGTSDGLPAGTLSVNLVGAFALGALLEWLSTRESDVRRRRAARLLVGTGFLGGFTTYSALAVEADGLLRDGRLVLALIYALTTVVVGLLASLAGVLSVRAAAR
jgi:fluoride exporter